MGKENDDKIKTLLTAIEKKREELGSKPKANWATNGVLKFGGESVNINTINSLEKCVSIAATLLMEKGAYQEACKFIGVKISDNAGHIDDMLDDLRLRAQMVKYDEEKKKLVAMEAKLKDLRSDDLKTADALSDIMSSLA